MSQIMRGSLLSLSAALLLLLPWFDGLAEGEVKKGFSDCLRFFYNKKLPTGLGGDYSNIKEYQPICQRYKKNWRFATLYQKKSRTPLFSAYIMSPAEGGRPADPWMYEPQLANPKSNWEMQPFQTPVPKDVIESQAVLDDYKNSGFTRGHLAPSSHQNTKEDKEATFTLTNIVPQKEQSNSGPWETWEEKVRKSFKNYCKGEMYVITGVMPYESNTPLINGRVAVPEYIWSAYCCPKYASKLPEKEQKFFPAYGAVGRNDPNSNEKIVKKTENYHGYDVREMPLENLESILKKRTNRKGDDVNLFDSKCSKPKNP
ncbi:endonuclease domain-containing 1 protein-like [Cyprinodon tularosa]|uniref:endonuclease domain-containing 1 protein-like n=1 Tax=Cyprinodon tularosa TaxID=77115 RepID=UPI0018E28693|nr:endonuclease domain-containing 1 protein-like [Cyprinodon tularosa]